MDYGVKVSKVGIDVKTADDKDLVMNSELDMLKTAGFGALASGGDQAHGLAYVPVHFSIRKVVGTVTRYTATWGTDDVGADSTNIHNGTADEIRYYFFHQESIA